MTGRAPMVTTRQSVVSISGRVTRSKQRRNGRVTASYHIRFIPTKQRKTEMKTSLASALIVSGALATGVATSATAQGLPQPVQDAIYVALDDEYHAQAFYAAVMGKFGEIRPFSNIIRAEQSHAAALANLLQSYGLAVPANPYASGDKALEPVPASAQEACSIGVSAEIANVALYDQQLLPAVQGYGDVVGVMQNLRDASADKHLPAFERCASGQMGQGNGGHGKGGQGHGQGHGQGQGHSQGYGQGQGHGQGQGQGKGWRRSS